VSYCFFLKLVFLHSRAHSRTLIWLNRPLTGIWLNFNCIYAKSKGANSELAIVELLKSYCLPFLLYGLEAVSLTDSNARALDNCTDRAMYRIFGVGDHENVKQVSHAFGLFSIKRINRKEETKISWSIDWQYWLHCHYKRNGF